MKKIQAWFATGEPYIWLNAGAVSVCVLMVAGLLFLIASRGLGHFWPTPVAKFQYQDADNEVTGLMGEIVDEETVSASHAGVSVEHARSWPG